MTRAHLLVALLALTSLLGCGARTSLNTPEPSPRPPVCGDRVVGEGEACDDGNASSADACVEGCELARCGDGLKRKGFEACDDGNSINTDGCRNTCALPSCGDGVVDPGEECDDGNAIDTDACPSLCLFAQCGDGFVQQFFEECDEGAANSDRPAFELTQGPLARPVAPVRREASAEGFYAYKSASGHTGFEAAGASRLFLYRDLGSGLLSLVTEHGIDQDATGIEQPKSRVTQSFLFLPSQVYIALTDDNDEKELVKDSPTSVRGDWRFHGNTDGGVLSALTSPGEWSIDVALGEVEGIGEWTYVDANGSLVTLETASTATLTSFEKASACRLDCTVPRCGDGILDGGEICDDGNTAGSDGCSADCQSTD